MGVFICATFFSCVNTKKYGSVWIPKGQSYFKKWQGGIILAPADSMGMYRLNQGAKAKLKIPDGAPPNRFEITFIENVDGKETLLNKYELTGLNSIGYGTFFPRDDTLVSLDKGYIFQSNTFKFWEYRPVLQALSVPLKIRPRLNDSTASIASSSFNVGFAYGFKLTKNIYRKYYYSKTGSSPYSLLNNNFKKVSFSPGFFIGPTIVDLKATNTTSIIKKDRSVAALTTGGYLVVGYNEINLGFAFGMDKTFGPLQGKWIYNGKPWFGVVVALDIIK